MNKHEEFVTKLRKCSAAVFLACDEVIDKDISSMLKKAADIIEECGS